MSRYLDPKIDTVFKKIFGEHPNILKSFLNAMLPLPEDALIAELTYLPSEQVPVIPEFKNTITDVKCTDTQGRVFIVEMQIQWTSSFMQRLLYGVSTAYVRQLNRSEAYHALRPVYGLGIVNDIFDKETQDWYHHYQLIHNKNNQKTLDDIQLLFIELPKFTPKTFTEKKLQVLWLRFMSEVGEDTQDIPSEWFDVPEIQQALSLAEEARYTPAELESYNKYWDSVRTQRSYVEDAQIKGEKRGLEKGRAEGEKRGIEKGRAEGKMEGIEATLKAIALIKQHVDDKTIAKKTGLSLTDITKIRG